MEHIDYQYALDTWSKVKQELSKVLVGQDYFIDRLLMAIAVQGHVLVEGLPGLAKTLTINLLGRVLQTSVSRIQFTPDLLPADVTGTMIYNQQRGEFKPHKGPVFSNFVIADEINRAPAKVQSALLQAMEERSVTLGNSVMNLPNPFIVMATQNPIEQEGTFELPEAQLDRFLFKLELGYASVDEEMEILKRVDKLSIQEVGAVAQLSDIVSVGNIAKKVTVTDSILRYIAQIVSSTRKTSMSIGVAERYIDYGASPRASIALLKCSRVMAVLAQRDFVSPEDVKNVAMDILRHRLVLSFDAIGNGVDVNGIIANLLNHVNIPK